MGHEFVQQFVGVIHAETSFSRVLANINAGVNQFRREFIAVRSRCHDQHCIAYLQPGRDNATKALDQRGMLIVNMYRVNS